MSSGSINFSLERFNKLFPFYLMIGHEMEIISYGSSMYKICNSEFSGSFNDIFHIKRPSIDAPDYDALLALFTTGYCLSYYFFTKNHGDKYLWTFFIEL